MLQFSRKGEICSQDARDQLNVLLATGNYTDIYLLCPGWNDGWYSAVAWMTSFATGYEQARIWAAPAPRRTRAYRPLYVGILWRGSVMNRAYPARGASGQAVALRPDVDRTALLNVLHADPSEQVVARIHQALADRRHHARSLRLENLLASPDELTPPQQLELADCLLPLFGPQAEPSAPGMRYALMSGRGPVVRGPEPRKVGLLGVMPAPLPPMSAAELLEVWKESVRTASATIPRSPEEPGDDHSLRRRRGLSVPELVRWALHATDLRVIKDRAFRVGRTAIAGVLKDLSATEAKIHVVGHSFGAEAVLAAIQGVSGNRPETESAAATPAAAVDTLLLLSPLINAWALAAPPMVGREVLPALQEKATPGGYRSAVAAGVGRSAIVVYSTRDWFAAYYVPLALRRPPFEGMAPPDSWAGLGRGFAAMGGIGPQGVEPAPIQQDLIVPGTAPEGPLRYAFPQADPASGPNVISIDGSKTIWTHGDANDRTTWWLLANQVEGGR